MNELEHLEGAIRDMDPSLAYIQGQMYLALADDKSWLVEHQPMIHLAWFVIMHAKHCTPGQISIAQMVIYLGDAHRYYQIAKPFCPLHGHHYDVRSECDMLATDLDAMSDATGMSVIYGMSIVGGSEGGFSFGKPPSHN